MASGNVPSQVLSDAFREHLANRRVRDLVFLTFSFEPQFFETEILPAFIADAPSSHEKVRLMLLEEELRKGVEVAVYYDPAALCAGDGSSKLPIRRVPVRRKTGCFHPKNVLALVEDELPDESGRHRRHLIVATMSANATRAGWWRNVEACHIEVLSEGQAHSLRDDLLSLISLVKREVDDDREPHEALEHIRKFVVGIEPLSQRSRNGVFFTRMSLPGESIEDFLGRQLGRDVVGLNLEVISPFFDDTDAKPLRALVERFAPAETRVLLPRNARAEACCEERYYDAVEGIEGCHWAQLPDALLSGGGSQAAAKRDVHAKVYRFFHPTRRFEVMLVGSPNLTNAAHTGKGNFETAVLVDVQPKRVSEWWLSRKTKRPTHFAGGGDEGPIAVPGSLTALSLRYDWTEGRAEAFWDGETASPDLTIDLQTARLRLGSLPPRQWNAFADEDEARIRERLRYTSFAEVQAPDCEPATILILEDGMEEKPSLALELTAAEILRYWALLTPERRAEFFETKFEALSAEDKTLFASRLAEVDSMFSTFAGIYRSFAALRAELEQSVARRHTKAIHARLFAKKADSLATLLERVEKDFAANNDAVHAYLIQLCALELLRATVELVPPEEERTRKAARSLRSHVERRAAELISAVDLPPETDRTEFFAWFEQWFFKRIDISAESDAA